jgi:hypothetical protein
MNELFALKMQLAKKGVNLNNTGLSRGIQMPNYEPKLNKWRYPKDGEGLWVNPFRKKQKKNKIKKDKKSRSPSLKKSKKKKGKSKSKSPKRLKSDDSNY